MAYFDEFVNSLIAKLDFSKYCQISALLLHWISCVIQQHKVCETRSVQLLDCALQSSTVKWH